MAPASAQEPPPEPPLRPFQPFRIAQFSRYLADGTEVLDEPIIRDGGRLNLHERFPFSHFDREPNDGLNIGRIFSSPSGVRYGVEVQSPGNSLFNVADPTREVGNKAELTQFQNFRKDSDDATLHYTVTAAEIEAVDESFRPPARPDECPGLDTTCQFTMEGEVALTVAAYLTNLPPEQQQLFYLASGAAKMTGFVDSFLPEIYIDPFATDIPWDETHFEFDGDADPNGIPGSFAFLHNEFILTSEVDISSVPVGEEFTLEVNTFARSYDRRLANGDDRLGSTVFAYLRDPLEVGGSPQLQTTGLTRVADPLIDPPPPAPIAPVECDSGPDPDAGTLQFSTTASEIGEWEGAAPQVFVTRTGGSAGEVSATVTTSDGTAAAGPDYVPFTSTIRFGDGDTTARAVPVEIVKDAIAEDEKTVTVTLSEPSCTTLGAPSSTVLTIVDDEPEPEFTIGGTVTGLEGSGLVLKNGFEEITPGNGPFEFTNTEFEGDTYDVTVDAQPSEPTQICTVTNGSGTVAEADITDVVVDCVTPPPDADLDPSFGDGGKVTTPGLETVQAIAVQPDGKIVASSDNALARYDTDGTLDETFGDAGVVPTTIDADNCFPSGANDLALQPDGKIVVVGLVSGAGGSDDEDVAVQRYEADGDLDTGFGDQGTVTTDFGGSRDCAYGVTIQADGKIVVAGEANGVDVAVLRYDSAGIPDPSFGIDGTGFVTTDIGGAVGGELDAATDVTLDPAGNIVVVARVSNDGGVDFFSVLRYTPAGVLDSTFAGDGITGFDPGTAESVAIDVDGRIVVAGSFDVGFDSQVAAWRFLPNGDPDSTFSGDGVTTANFSDGFSGDIGRDLVLQPDGKIVAVGTAEGVNRGDLAMARWGTDGSLDSSFGNGGMLTVDFHAGFDSGQAIALQPDGKIVAAGSAVNVTSVEQTLVRVLP